MKYPDDVACKKITRDGTFEAARKLAPELLPSIERVLSGQANAKEITSLQIQLLNVEAKLFQEFDPNPELI